MVRRRGNRDEQCLLSVGTRHHMQLTLHIAHRHFLGQLFTWEIPLTGDDSPGVLMIPPTINFKNCRDFQSSLTLKEMSKSHCFCISHIMAQTFGDLLNLELTRCTANVCQINNNYWGGDAENMQAQSGNIPQFWQSTCLPCTRSWGLFPTLPEPSLMGHCCNPRAGRQRKKIQKFKVTSGYLVSSGRPRTTYGPVSKQQKLKKCLWSFLCMF